MMIAEVNGKCQKKKRDASYYREYRKRKKSGTSNILQFPTLSTGRPAGPFSLGDQKKCLSTNPEKPYQNQAHQIPSKTLSLKALALIIFVILLTGMLVHLSVPFYMQGHSKTMAYLMASLVEISLLFLLTMQTSGAFDRFAKYFLIFALSAYALVPIALNPVKETKSKLAIEQNHLETQAIKVQSLQSEISSRKVKAQLLQERGRITLAQSELQTIATLEIELRNTVSVVQPIANTDLEINSSYAVAIQRFLLMLCNLFFVHQLVAQQKFNLRKPKRFVPLLNNMFAT